MRNIESVLLFGKAIFFPFFAPTEKPERSDLGSASIPFIFTLNLYLTYDLKKFISTTNFYIHIAPLKGQCVDHRKYSVECSHC